MAHRRRRTELRTGGYTLVEVVVAILLTGIMTVSVFSAALTSKASTGKSDRTLIASQAARQLTSRLKSFVTPCCDPLAGTCDVAVDCGSITGPNTSRGGAARWYFQSPGGSPIGDEAGDVYALTQGQHVITGLLPSWFESSPYGARVIYDVRPINTAHGYVSQVDVTVSWTEP